MVDIFALPKNTVDVCDNHSKVGDYERYSSLDYLSQVDILPKKRVNCTSTLAVTPSNKPEGPNRYTAWTMLTIVTKTLAEKMPRRRLRVFCGKATFQSNRSGRTTRMLSAIKSAIQRECYVIILAGKQHTTVQLTNELQNAHGLAKMALRLTQFHPC